MTSFSIATFNVNSITARIGNVLAWLDAAQPDVVLVQELKCVDEAFPRLEIEERGFHVATHGQKTYNGVAILSKFPLSDVERGLAGDDSDEQARYIEGIVHAHGQTVRVASAYVPNGQSVGSDKFAYKLKFYDRLYAHWQSRITKDEIAILGGDYNCAPGTDDVPHPEQQDGAVCYHPEERKRLRALLHLGLYDAFRLKHPTGKHYSWWDYRMGAYARNDGLRIDHLLLSARAADCLQDCVIDEVPRQQEKPSDHAPVMGMFDFGAQERD